MNENCGTGHMITYLITKLQHYCIILILCYYPITWNTTVVILVLTVSYLDMRTIIEHLNKLQNIEKKYTYKIYVPFLAWMLWQAHTKIINPTPMNMIEVMDWNHYIKSQNILGEWQWNG